MKRIKDNYHTPIGKVILLGMNSFTDFFEQALKLIQLEDEYDGLNKCLRHQDQTHMSSIPILDKEALRGELV